MKHKLRLHLVGILILVFCVSCGQSVTETIKPVVPAASGQFMRVVIVPFADHTPASSLSDHCRRNTLVLEYLQDALYQAGFISAPEEDVVQYLVDRGVIHAASGNLDSSGTAHLEKELAAEWSDQMKAELEDVIDETRKQERGNRKQKSIALDRKTLTNLGNAFRADYIVRGRIVEYNPDQIDSFNPLRTGLIPFVFKSTQRATLGMAESEMYDYVDMESIETYGKARHMLWGAGGFLTGLIGDKQGRVPGATVQIRALVQDARTGDVVWLNRAEACSLPRSAFSDPATDRLFAMAIDTAVNSLVDDFANAYASGRIATNTRVSAVSEESAEGSEIEAFVVEVAAEKAKRSAKEAKESAEQAKEAALKAGEAKEFAQNAEAAAAEAQKASGDAKDAVKRASEASVKSEKIFKKIIAK
jgi:hypothetical protein